MELSVQLDSSTYEKALALSASGEGSIPETISQAIDLLERVSISKESLPKVSQYQEPNPWQSFVETAESNKQPASQPDCDCGSQYWLGYILGINS